MFGFEVAVGNGNPAVELDLRLVDGIAGVRVEHLIAWVHEGEHELADDRLSARLDGDVLSAVAKPVRGVDVGARPPAAAGCRLRAVAGLAVPNGS